ncbi:hypothetical protein N656DRAFT_795564 [Canariomyces notabilis]|uniref:Uncharacterized protein n=1 Tax=Canariomyces notabilis TaxID=2074819 RepID=A0AAN6TJY9_9PEZI|nr:hypothetical protein N656DRAFT_795564 [Canariomyces arenarius]
MPERLPAVPCTAASRTVTALGFLGRVASSYAVTTQRALSLADRQLEPMNILAESVLRMANTQERLVARLEGLSAPDRGRSPAPSAFDAPIPFRLGRDNQVHVSFRSPPGHSRVAGSSPTRPCRGGACRGDCVKDVEANIVSLEQRKSSVLYLLIPSAL